MLDFHFSLRDDTGLFPDKTIRALADKNAWALETCKKGQPEFSDSLGWLDVDEWAGEDWISKYKAMAEEIALDADAFVVIGIGGSNQAARAVYEALGKKNNVDLIWAGNSISAHSINEVIRSLADKKNIYIDVIAKNFETLEPGIGFRAMREVLRSRYGTDYARHVVVTFTEDTHSSKIAKEKGYKLLPFPSDIGGRYTALSPVGLFPLAVAGYDIAAMAEGAKAMRQRLFTESGISNDALLYASLRTELYNKGKRVEFLSYFEPRFFRFAKWWKQLFGESEGKDDKGLLPVDACFSEDLHSLGQFIQEGSPVLFETFLNLTGRDSSLVINDDELADGFHYLDKKDFFDINQVALEATLRAHSKRFPCLVFSFERLDEEAFGYLFYFFEFACYISCLITGVNPFDQNGVEAYKKDMFKLLGK